MRSQKEECSPLGQVRRLFAVCFTILVYACGEVNTVGEHFPGMEVYSSREQGYHIHYANPPWSPASQNADYGTFQPVLVVRAMYLGVDLSLVSYQLEVESIHCVSLEEAAISSLGEAMAEGESIVFRVRQFVNRAGDEGLEFLTLDGAGSLAGRLSLRMQAVVQDHGFVLRARRVFFMQEPGRCVRLSMYSVYDLEEAEVDFMLSSFEPRPAVLE